VDFNYDKGSMQLKGRSIPEDSVEFYLPLKSWVERYAGDPKPTTKVDLALEYFNTNSSKQIMDFFKKLEALHKLGTTQLEVNWFYEENDLDMMETGEDFCLIFDLPINTISVDRFDF
jgi:hypothetical protein